MHLDLDLNTTAVYEHIRNRFHAPSNDTAHLKQCFYISKEKPLLPFLFLVEHTPILSL